MHYFNKFEIPLTVEDTEDIFNALQSPKYKDYIQSVYLPPHSKDGGSGRPFVYEYSQSEYYRLIRRILKLKDVIITYPYGDYKTLRKYIALGVRRFMVSKWSDDCDKLKKDFPDIHIERSIVGNSYNEEIDYRFDGVVLPYVLLMDIEKIKEISKKIKVTVLVNHYCRVGCPYLDAHLQASIDVRDRFDRTMICQQDSKAYFIPKKILDEIIPYVSTVKLIERMDSPAFYKAFMNHYITGEYLSGLPQYQIEQQNRMIKSFKNRNVGDVSCRFKCDSCLDPCI